MTKRGSMEFQVGVSRLIFFRSMLSNKGSSLVQNKGINNSESFALGRPEVVFIRMASNGPGADKS